MKKSSKTIALSLILASALGSMFFLNTANAANWKERKIVRHGHHKVIVTQHCRGNKWHHVCRVQKHKRVVRHPRRWW